MNAYNSSRGDTTGVHRRLARALAEHYWNIYWKARSSTVDVVEYHAHIFITLAVKNESAIAAAPACKRAAIAG
jgi:hypothetical protein